MNLFRRFRDLYSMKNEISHIQEQILVMDAQDGSAEALNQLVERWQKPLWNHAYRLVGDADIAWDVTQQSWIGIIKGLRKLQDAAGFKAWAYRIVTNKSFDWIKKNTKQKHVSIDDLPECEDSKKTDTGAKELLNKLDSAKRLVVNLHYFERLSVAEISMILNIPKGTVKSRLHNARNELKQLWLQTSH